MAQEQSLRISRKRRMMNLNEKSNVKKLSVRISVRGSALSPVIMGVSATSAISAGGSEVIPTQPILLASALLTQGGSD